MILALHGGHVQAKQKFCQNDIAGLSQIDTTQFQNWVVFLRFWGLTLDAKHRIISNISKQTKEENKMTKSAQINSQMFADQYQEALMEEAMQVLAEMDLADYILFLEAEEAIIADRVDWFSTTH